jgi:RNA-directed DNA polymerase
MMDEHGKSDKPILPEKTTNKAGKSAAEWTEGRGLAKENLRQQNAFRTQRRGDVHSALERVREAARKNKGTRFTALFHYVCDVDMLEYAYFRLKKEAAPGVDGETWRHYAEDLEQNLQDLSHRLQRGAYRAKPVRRTYIPKSDGRQRPLGVTALEDKIVQRAAVEVWNAIYEVDFVDFSYGFRPGRSQHKALDQLYVGIHGKKVNWVLDLDIRSFFDTLSQNWLVKFVEHRIGDRRVVRLIQKWLRAGVLEEGKLTVREEGTPQGGSASPLLANVYLHHVFDLWTEAWRRKIAHGDILVVRFADDIVVGFQEKAEAERFWNERKERMKKFELELHPEKTRLLEFGRYAAERRQKRSEGKPETFNFLGFTHICGKTRKGSFAVIRQTIRKRMQAKLTAINTELRRRMHTPLKEQGSGYER